MPLTAIEHLVLKGTALRHQMKKVEKTFDELFITPVRRWLRGQPDHRAIVADVARPLLRITNARPKLDGGKMLEDLRTLVHEGAITGDTLKSWVLSGHLDLMDNEITMTEVATRIGAMTGRDLAYYTDLVVTKKDDSVQWDCIHRGMERVIVSEFSELSGIDAIVRNAATVPFPDAVVDRIAAAARLVNHG